MNVNYVLPDNSFFLLNNAIIAHIASQNGPHARAIFDPKLHGFDTIENVTDVAVGDFVNTGNEYGKVTAATNSGGIVTITAKLKGTKPAGMSVADWRTANGLKTVIWKFAIVAAAGATPNRVVFQSLDNQGCVFYRPVNAVGSQAPLFTLAAAPTFVDADTTKTITVRTNGVAYTGGASVQLTVNGVAEGSPVTTNGSGQATFARNYAAGELIRFIVSDTGYNTITFGPYTVAP